MKIFRIVIDITMYILFVLLMGHHIIGGLSHEILGIILFALFITHNVLNYKFYKSIFKGKYTSKRIFTTIIDILFLLIMLGMIISAIMISKEIFAFFNIERNTIANLMHMFNQSWGFIIMSIHVGMHVIPIISKIKEKNKIVFFVLFVISTLYGAYCFYKMNFISDMFLLNHFKMYSFEEHPAIFYLHTLFSSVLMVNIVYILSNVKRRKN